ncbi:MAG TPA: hypothetical protein VK904_03500 [Miltoncostaeaceae bacterium]|nr:hypothetical protein [Miltoncostaeaceae bacterium]
MGGLGVVVLVVTLGALAAVMGRPAVGRRLRPRGRRRALPSWIREPPLPPEEAERRSLELLRSVVNEDEWEQFCELGFICITGRRGARAGRPAGGPPRYRYLIYPHLPVVALLPRSMAPVREYCVQFPERGGEGTPLLPRVDDVVDKLMALRADEDLLVSYGNVGNAGCQVPLGRIERDIARLERWTARRAREAQNGGSGSPAGGSPGAAGRSSAVSSSILR